jgi:hypothetical protein
MRSAEEIRFRLRQEAANILSAMRAPRLEPSQPAPLALLPAPAVVVERLRGSPMEAQILELAEKILAHRFPLLGFEIETGPSIAWRRDYLSGIESRRTYFRLIRYLDPSRCGDHKVIWELNRHQHLVLLAQAQLLTGDARFGAEIRSQIENWERDNPFHRGINWASALEVAFRALSWIWVYHLVGAGWDEAFRRLFLSSLYRHGHHLETNLSIYFSPNTHLLGEAVVLHALGVLFPTFPNAARWAALGAEVVARQMDVQVREDGSHFEQSSYYQVYALDLFLLHDVLAPKSARYRRKLAAMADYLRALHTPAGTLPFLGDDDGGRMFHPYGPRDRFGVNTLAACAARLSRPDLRLSGCAAGAEACWWLPDELAPPPAHPSQDSVRLFEHAGMVVISAGDSHVLFDAGPFGALRSGHSHSDTLSLVVSGAGRDILIDPGTYTYSDPVWRQRFRGSSAHNTVRVDGRDQAIPSGPFAWLEPPEVEILKCEPGEDLDSVEAECRYGRLLHRRRIRFQKPCRLRVLDELVGLPGEHEIEQFWHLGLPVTHITKDALVLGDTATVWMPNWGTADLSVSGEWGWHSTVYGEKHPAPVLRVRLRARLPLRLGVVLDWRPAAERDAPAAEDAAFLAKLRTST